MSGPRVPVCVFARVCVVDVERVGAPDGPRLSVSVCLSVCRSAGGLATHSTRRTGRLERRSPGGDGADTLTGGAAPFSVYARVCVCACVSMPVCAARTSVYVCVYV